MAEPERLQKVLAHAGLGSRRACEEMIIEGLVRVNGRVAELGARVDPETDEVEVEGVRVDLNPQTVYYALNKPTGVVSTAKDTRGRKTVLDFVPPEPRVFPVGRLDQDTSGLILLTNDGDFAQRVAHPRYGVGKTYVAEVQGTMGPKHVRALKRGVVLPDGPVHVDRAELTDVQRGRSLVELEVHEGRNRMVRRLLEELGFPVVWLARTAIGPVRLGRTRPGTWRHLRRTEVLELESVAQGAGPVD